MKFSISAVLVALCMVFASLGADAQEMSFRKGVVTGISPIQVQGQQQASSGGNSHVGGALGRMFGRVVGRAASRATGEYSYEAYDVASSAAQDVVSGATSGGASAGAGNTTNAFMVMVKFDDGSESAIQSAQVSNLRIGGRVRVFGSGSSAQIVAE